LSGTDPATIPIRDVLDQVPRQVVVNTKAVADLKDPGRCPPTSSREPTSSSIRRAFIAKRRRRRAHRIPQRIESAVVENVEGDSSSSTT
jgi:hypothetical protein